MRYVSMRHSTLPCGRRTLAVLAFCGIAAGSAAAGDPPPADASPTAFTPRGLLRALTPGGSTGVTVDPNVRTVGGRGYRGRSTRRRTAAPAPQPTTPQPTTPQPVTPPPAVRPAAPRPVETAAYAPPADPAAQPGVDTPVMRELRKLYGEGGRSAPDMRLRAAPNVGTAAPARPPVARAPQARPTQPRPAPRPSPPAGYAASAPVAPAQSRRPPGAPQPRGFFDRLKPRGGLLGRMFGGGPDVPHTADPAATDPPPAPPAPHLRYAARPATPAPSRAVPPPVAAAPAPAPSAVRRATPVPRARPSLAGRPGYVSSPTPRAVPPAPAAEPTPAVRPRSVLPPALAPASVAAAAPPVETPAVKKLAVKKLAAKPYSIFDTKPAVAARGAASRVASREAAGREAAGRARVTLSMPSPVDRQPPVGQLPGVVAGTEEFFPDLPEAVADAGGSPYTGLSLDTGVVRAAKPAGATPAEPTPAARPAAPAVRERVVRVDPRVAPPAALPPLRAANDRVRHTPVRPAAADRPDPSVLLGRLRDRGDRAGLMGFCPVTLRDRRDLVDADPRYVAGHDGREYRFASTAARTKFLTDPDRYAPAAAGVDVVLREAGWGTKRGSLTHAVWYHNRLYLFVTRESMKRFMAEPGVYAGE